MRAPLLNKSFSYISAEDSRKPGYLKRRMALYLKHQQDDAKEAKENRVIVQIPRKAR